MKLKLNLENVYQKRKFVFTHPQFPGCWPVPQHMQALTITSSCSKSKQILPAQSKTSLLECQSDIEWKSAALHRSNHAFS